VHIFTNPFRTFPCFEFPIGTQELEVSPRIWPVAQN
jgi:hypothetical protein